MKRLALDKPERTAPDVVLIPEQKIDRSLWDKLIEE